MDNIDVVKELERKNREIYLNKLTIDLEKSEESIIISSGNQFSKLINEVSNTISLLTKDSSLDVIEKHIKNFFDLITNKLNALLKERSTSLKEKLGDIDKDEYKEELEIISSNIINAITLEYQKNTKLVTEEFGKNMDNFNLERLNNYLNEIVLKKIINNLKENFLYANMIIYNDYLENYERMQNINKKTLIK